MHITIDIPALQSLADALNRYTDTIGDRTLPVVDGPASPTTVTEPAVTEAPKRTRRTKTDDPKEVEQKTGRRVEGLTDTISQPEPAVAAGPVSFKWTVPLLKDTFAAAIQPANDSQEEKDRCNALRKELNAVRKEVDPNSENLVTLGEQHYDEFARRAVAWFEEKDIALTLPEGYEP